MNSKIIIIIFFFTCFSYTNNVIGQSLIGNVKISGQFLDKGFKIVEISKCGIRSHLNYDPDFEIPVNINRTFQQTLKIMSPSYYRIGDLFVGHTIFLEPFDSIDIKFIPVPNFKTKINNGEMIGKQYSIAAKSKYYGNIIFFDELDKLIGVTIKYKFEEPLLFKEKCKVAFDKSIKLLNDFKAKGIISENFYRYTIEDLKARHLLWFCEMLSQKNNIKYKSILTKDFKTNLFSDSVFAVASDKYSTASSVYNYYIANNFNPKNYYSNLSNEFASILKNYIGLVRDRLMGWQIEDYIGKEYPSFDSCYQVFLIECNNSKIRNEVINKVISYMKPIKNLNKIELKSLLRLSNLKSINETKMPVLNAISDSVVNLIDCWATWCIPCRNQMPYVHELQKKYGARLNIIYLSFDKDINKWKLFLEKNNLKINQYIINNDFGSEFSKYFDIQAIPRYILISKGGIKVLNAKMPLPALQEEFEEELKKYLN